MRLTKLFLVVFGLFSIGSCAVETDLTSFSIGQPRVSVPPGTPLPANPCPVGTMASLPNMTILCPFQTKTEVAKDWTISDACSFGDGGWNFSCNGACKVKTGAPVNEPPDHFPYCEPGGPNAPAYNSGCATVEPPMPSDESEQPIRKGYHHKDKATCEAERAKGCEGNFGTAVELCESQYGSEPVYVEGRMGVCCLGNGQQQPPPQQPPGEIIF